MFSKRRSPSVLLRYYGCYRPTGRKIFLGPRPGDADLNSFPVSRFRIAGTLVAYAYTKSPFRGNDEFFVHLRRVTDGKVIRRLPAAIVRDDRFEDEIGDGVKDLVVASNGAAAWIIVNPYSGPRTTEVYVARAGLAPVLVDHGDNVHRNSLTRRGCNAYWQNGAVEMVSALC